MALEVYGTLGPSCCSRDVLIQLIEAGMTGIRLNLSHGSLQKCGHWINAFQKACRIKNQKLDFMIDMHGSELRLSDFQDPFVLLDAEVITLDHKIIPDLVINHAETNDLLLVDDGKIQLRVLEKTCQSLVCRVMLPGTIKPRKSIAVQGKTILGPVLTEADLSNLQVAASYGVTSVMQPFVTSKQDLLNVKEVLQKLHLEHLKIYAKIENMSGVEHLEEIAEACDVIVIARGDLANACSLEKLPCIQKEIERICKIHHKPYMVVTEMLHSMVDHPAATRAEVSDIFHAVYHGASAIMLTAETASGKYPVEAMRTFVKTAHYAEEYKKENDI